jgi:cell division protein ZapA (FtsZ GTPase activity inhibitor)
MENGAERKSVRVTIFNQTYSIGVSGDPAEAEEVAHAVDELMTDIAAQARNADTARVAVMAALNLAGQLRSLKRELTDIKTRVDSKTREFSILLDQVIE